MIFLQNEYMGKIEIRKFFDTRTEASPHAINYKIVVLLLSASWGHIKVHVQVV